MKSIYTDYDGFAWFYNRYWSRRYNDSAVPVIERILLSKLKRGAPVLDLCCGAGHLSRYLAERGFQVTGLDGSKELLKFALNNVPQGRFIVGDARKFSFAEKFDAVLCTFDSINHILQWEELVSVFRNVRSVLNGGGSFLFDLNMEEAYLTMWDKMSAEVEDESVCIVRGGYSPEEKLGRTEITGFRLLPGSGWKRSDSVVYQKCYSLDDINSALKQGGFRDFRSYDARNDLQMTGDIGKGRNFFMAFIQL